MKTEQEYQDAIDLTPEQVKAFTALKKAVTRCEKENIYFYQNLETLHALNGNNVRTIEIGGDSLAPNCLQYKFYPGIMITCSFADDNHYVVLMDE